MSNNNDTAIVLRKDEELKNIRASFIALGLVYIIIHFMPKSVNSSLELPIIGLYIFPPLFFGAYFLMNKNSWVKKKIINIRFALFLLQMFYFSASVIKKCKRSYINSKCH